MESCNEQSYTGHKFCSHAPATKFGDATSFDLTLVSVDNLQCERWFSQNIRVFSEVKLDGGAIKETGRYLADRSKSTLNYTVQYPITKDTRGDLVVRLYYKRTFRDDSIGEETIDMTRLFRRWCSHQNTETIKLRKGNLKIEYSFKLA